MAIHYPGDATKTIGAILPVGLTSGTQSAEIDCRGFEVAKVVFTAGAFSTGDRTATVSLEESATGSGDWSAIPGAEFDEVDEDSDSATFLGTVRLRGRKRYLRVVVAIAGSSGLPTLAVSVSLSGPDTTARADNTFAFEVGVPA